MIDRKIAPVIKNAVDFHFQLKPVEKWTLDNGVEVYALNGGEEEVMQLEWVFYAGNSWEQRNMVAGATNFLLKNGTTTRSAFDINDQFEFYGSYINRNCYNETSNITLHSLNKYVHELLPVVRDMLTNSIFPQEELDIFVQNSKQRLAVNLLKCDFVASREIDVLLYGKDHPYGKYSTAEDLDALNRDAILQFYQQYYQQGTCVMFVAGKLPSNLFALLNEQFGQLPWKPAQIQPATPLPLNGEPPAQRIHRISNDTNGVQGAIRIARNFPNRHHPDFPGVQILNVLFGGYFGSRLMENIREEKGYTYGIHSYLQNHVEQSAWVISTEAGRDVCEATIKEVYYEMEQLRNAEVDEEELLLVRNYLLGSLLGDLDGPFQIIGRWKSYILAGLDESHFYKAIDNIKNISAKRLHELANQYLQPDMFHEMVVV
ncbi:MAG TPA: pitrilysin family protein [Phnomibacter sp.]|nr:pitrilysin family protein [Phnomibacter sp.]